MVASPDPTSISGFALRVRVIGTGDDQAEDGDGGGDRQHPLLEAVHGGLAGQVGRRELDPPADAVGVTQATPEEMALAIELSASLATVPATAFTADPARLPTAHAGSRSGIGHGHGVHS